MRLFTLSSSRMSRLLIATILVLTAFFLLYFFVYVQHRREYLHEKAFRVLNQAGGNLNAKYQTLITNARREISYRAAMKADEADYARLSLDSLGRSVSTVDSVQVAGKRDPVQAKTYKKLYERKRRMPMTAEYNPLLEFTDVRVLASEAPAPHFGGKTDATRVAKYPPGQAGPAIPLGAQLDSLTGQYLHFEDTVRVIQVESGKVTPLETMRIAFRVKLKDFMRDAITGQEDLFDGYQLFRERSVAFTTVLGGMAITGGDTLISNIINAGATRTKHGYSHATSRVVDVEIAGKPYKLFLQRVQIGQIGEGLALGLLMGNRNYREHIFEVPMSTILLCSLVMLVLMLGYPFIKLRLIGNGERLKTEDAFFCALSVVISFFLVTLIALSYYVYKVPEDQVNRQHLQRLATSVKDNFVQELKDIREQFAEYDSSQFGAIRKLSEGKESVDILAAGRHQLPYPNRYPYFDMVFWIDENGNPLEQLHTGSVLQPFVNVKDRDYFLNIKEGRPWNLDLTGKHPQPFTVQPIFNRITGENMAVVAVPYHTPQVADSIYRPVVASDVKMHSVIRPVMPLGYGFCIMDREGLIWFHSDQRKNLQEYFPQECGEDSELLSALQGNVSRHLHLTYNGQHYSAYGTPLPQMPLYLVVFHQESYFNSIRTLSTSVTIVHYLLALLPLCLLLLVHKVTFYYDSRLRGENFAFRWLAPNHGKERQYRLLLALLCALIVLEVVMLFAHHNERDAWAFYVLVIITSFAAVRTLLYNDLNLLGLRFWSFWTAYFCMAGLLVFCIVRQWFGNPLGGPQSLVIQSHQQTYLSTQWLVLAGEFLLTLAVTTGLVALFAMLRLVALRWFRNPAGRTATASHALYPRLLFAWVILLSILPALSFYRTNYLREHRIAAGHGLVQAARDLTQRKLRVQAQYRDLKVQTNDPETDTIRKELISQHGRYVGAVNGTQVVFHNEPNANRGVAWEKGEADNRFVDLLPVLRLRPLYNRMAAENNLLLKADTAGNHWRWKAGLRPDSLQLGFFEYDLAKPRQNYLTLSATIPAYAWGYLFLDHEGWRIILLGLMGVVIIVGLLALIRFTVRHLFNFGIHETGGKPYFPEPPLPRETWQEMRNQKQRVLMTGSYLPDRNAVEAYFLPANPGGKAAVLGASFIDLVEVTEGEPLPPVGSAKGATSLAAETRPDPALHEDIFKDTATLAAPATKLMDHKRLVSQFEEAPAHLIITHFEQLTAWAANPAAFGAHLRHLGQLIEKAQSVLILSLQDPNDLKEKVEELIGKAGAANPVESDSEKQEKAAQLRAGRQGRESELLHWQHLIGSFEARFFSLEAFTGTGSGSQGTATNDETPGGTGPGQPIVDAPGNPDPDTRAETAGAAEERPGITADAQPAASPSPEKEPDGQAAGQPDVAQPQPNAKSSSARGKNWRKRYSWAAYQFEIAQTAFCRRKRWNRLVTEECQGHGPFLRSIEPDIRKIVETFTNAPSGKTGNGPAPVPGEDKRRGDIILKIQERSRLHYNALWESCTREEQYILYDLAQDGLVDCRNMQSLRALLQKGLIAYDGSVKLMNRSFRNYILHAIEPRHGSEIEAEIRQKSSWSEYRAVLALVIGAVITFIFLTQRETYNQIHAVITTLTASIPLILNLIGTMSFGGSKSGSH
jgi:hypothetical protein